MWRTYDYERGGERLSVSSYTSKLHQASHTSLIRLVYACVLCLGCVKKTRPRYDRGQTAPSGDFPATVACQGAARDWGAV